MKKTISVLLAIAIALYGCAHSTPNPVPIAQVGDDTKSCDAIANEMQQMVNAQKTAEGDRNAQIGSNVALGIAGIFLIVPWFFMNVGNAATVEEKAAQARYMRLQQMQVDRKCPPVPGLYAPPTNAASATPESAAIVATAPPAPLVAPVTTTVASPAPASTNSGIVATAAQPQAIPVRADPPPAVATSSKFMFNAERFAKDSGCPAPVASMTIKAPTYEAFTIACGADVPRLVRCDDSSCREMK
jgi:hypothetical protein